MAEYNFQANRFQSAFGFAAKNALPVVADIGYNGRGFYRNLDVAEPNIMGLRSTSEVSILGPAEAAGVSKMGTPVFDLVTLSHPSLRQAYTFQILPMIDFSRSKNIVSTPVNGGEGEVVEYIGMKPWSIRIRGLLVDMENHELPLDQLQELRNLFEFGEVLEVHSTLCNINGISSLYLMDLDEEFLEGFSDTIAFTLTATSHQPIELILLDN